MGSRVCAGGRLRRVQLADGVEHGPQASTFGHRLRLADENRERATANSAAASPLEAILPPSRSSRHASAVGSNSAEARASVHQPYGTSAGGQPTETDMHTIPIIDLSDPRSWPAAIIAATEANRDIFQNWVLGTPGRSPTAYDRATQTLQEVLTEVAVVGWHCTRLTAPEATLIRSNGLGLPNAAMLHARLDRLVGADMLTSANAAALGARHEADHPWRAGRIWFCFCPPRLAGEHGIRRFFHHWGGEALYNSHEDDPDTGPVLASIGTPSIVEAIVPLAGVYCGHLTDHVVGVYLRSLGVAGLGPDQHMDGYSLTPIAAENVRTIVTFPSAEFMALTECGGWRKPLRAG